MTDLRGCTVLVHDVNEYKAIVRIAKKQGFCWASGDSLDIINCTFPTKLEFDIFLKTRYGPLYHKLSRDYTCAELIGDLRKLILARRS